MAAKERHKQKVKQRIQDRLNGILLQEEALHSLIRDYVQQARTKAEELLATEDTGYFMHQYGSVEQLLDKVNNTCELLSTTAEDMIENSESDVTIQPDITVSSFNDSVRMNKQLATSPGETHFYTHTDPKTSTPDKSGVPQQAEAVENDLHEDSKDKVADLDTDQQVSALDKQGKLKKDEEIEKELKAILSSSNKEPEKHQELIANRKNLHQKNTDNLKVTLDVQTLTKQTGKCVDGGAKPKHSNSIIPSPVKKSIATYIRTDEESRHRNDSEHVTKDEISDTCRNTNIPSDKENNSVTVVETYDENDIRCGSAHMDAEKSVSVIREIDKFKPVKASSKTSLYMSDSSFHTLDGDTDCSDRAQSSQSIQNSSQELRSKSHNYTKNRSDSTSSREEGTTDTLMLEQSSLPSGKITPVVVSDIDNPWCFCVQSNAAQVNHLMEQICTYMSVHGKNEEPLQNPERGQMCLARFSKDLTFYRAYIMDCHEAGKEVEVLYVDYGNRERVKTFHLRKLPKRFYALPMQAICCSLAEVMPNNKYMLWTEDETLVFKQYVMNQLLNCVQACKCSNPEVPVIVRLLGSYPVPSVAGGPLVLNQLSIGEVLVNRGSAKYVNTVDQVGHLEKSGEGRKESSVLNKSGSHGKVVEIEDGKSIPSIDLTVVKQTKTGKEISEDDREESMKTYKTGSKDTKKAKNIKKNNQCSIDEKESSDKVTESKHSNGNFGKSCEQKQTRDSSLTTSTNDNSKDTAEKSYKKHEYHAGVGDEIETTSYVQNRNSDKYIKKEHITSEERKNTSQPNSKETVEHNEAPNVRECQDSKSILSTDENSKGTSIEGQEHENNKVVLEKIAEKTGIVDFETVSSTGTTDMDSERSTDTGFQSTEVTFDLQLNPKGEEVMLAHVQSPTHFYVHMLQVGQTLHSLMKSLNKHFEKMNRRKLTRLSQTFVPVANKLCCAQFLQDNNFYRAVILNIRSDSEVGVGKVHVHYLDFGDDEWLPKRRLFPLPPHYASVPPLAIKCKLAYVKPAITSDCVQADGDNFKWSDCATKAFIDLMGFEKTLHMLVVEGNLTSDCKGELVGGNEETLGVYLVDTNGTEEVCANMDLIRQNYAVLDVPEVWNINDQDPGDEMALMDWNPMEADFLSKRNSYKVDIEDAEMATVGYKSQDHKGICRYFSKGAHCWRGDNCPFRHVKTDSAVPLGREEVYCTDNQMEALPGVNSWVAAEVMTILTPGHFYILLPLGNKSLDGACDDSGQDENANIQCNESLDDLLIQLNVEYSKKSPNERTLQLKAPGEIVVARYSQDKQWYRARVIQVTEERVKVFFLDFGNTEWLPDEEIAEIMPEFLHLPFQAFECFLCGVEPTGDENWTTESKNVFRSLVDGKTLVAHIRSRSWNGCLSVDLYDTSETDDINIAEKLIEKNHATRCSFLTDSSCNGSVSGQSQRTNSERSEIIMVPG